MDRPREHRQRHRHVSVRSQFAARLGAPEQCERSGRPLTQRAAEQFAHRRVVGPFGQQRALHGHAERRLRPGRGGRHECEQVRAQRPGVRQRRVVAEGAGERRTDQRRLGRPAAVDAGLVEAGACGNRRDREARVTDGGEFFEGLGQHAFDHRCAAALAGTLAHGASLVPFAAASPRARNTRSYSGTSVPNSRSHTRECSP